MVKFLSLSSGSNGNCYYIGNDEIGLLIDVGIGLRTIKKRLLEYGISTDTISMILVTHDHGDHIKSLGPVAEKLSVPVFTTAKLHGVLENHYLTGGYLTGCKRIIKKDESLDHRGIKFTSFEVPHDATQTLGYYIDFMGVKFVFMTDLGDVPPEAMQYCRQASHLIIESNYDIDMLLSGNYPAMLKQRILEGNGHLSNDRCGEILTKIYHPNLKSIYLCHLSENNNTPDRAYNSACGALSSIGLSVGKDIKLYCLPRRNASPVFEFEKVTIL